MEGSPMSEEERKKYVLMYKGEYYIQQYGTKENYARQMSDFSTYAFITADGEWHETGRMGWFGMDDATRSSREAYRKAFDAYLEEGRKFAVEGGPEMLAKAAAENLGLAVSEVTLEPINIRVRADGDPTYLEYIKESVASGETDAYLYNDGIVRVKAKTAGGEICFEIDTVSRTVKQITRGTHLDEENWIVVEAE